MATSRGHATHQGQLTIGHFNVIYYRISSLRQIINQSILHGINSGIIFPFNLHTVVQSSEGLSLMPVLKAVVLAICHYVVASMAC